MDLIKAMRKEHTTLMETIQMEHEEQTKAMKAMQTKQEALEMRLRNSESQNQVVKELWNDSV